MASSEHTSSNAAEPYNINRVYETIETKIISSPSSSLSDLLGGQVGHEGGAVLHKLGGVP